MSFSRCSGLWCLSRSYMLYDNIPGNPLCYLPSCREVIYLQAMKESQSWIPETTHPSQISDQLMSTQPSCSSPATGKTYWGWMGVPPVLASLNPAIFCCPSSPQLWACIFGPHAPRKTPKESILEPGDFFGKNYLFIYLLVIGHIRRVAKNTQKSCTKKIFTTRIITMVWSLT